MKTSFKIVESFPVSPKQLYDAWLTSELHLSMTGGDATCSDEIGGIFSAWDGYISGENKTLKTDEEIVQTWRTTDFKAEDDDSELIIRFHKTDVGCQLELIHENIPEGQSDYEKGWIEHYFNPMKIYFSKK